MAAPPPGPVADLPIAATVAAAYRSFIGQLRFLPRAMAVPFLLSTLLWSAGLIVAGLDSFFALLSLVPQTLFGVAWYRLNLLGPVAGAPQVGFSWGRPHWRFLQYVILITLINILLIPIYAGPIFAAQASGGALSLGSALFALGALVAMGFIMVRLSFVFPAVAVGEDYGIKHAWRHSAGQGWRLLLGLFLVLLPMTVLLMIVSSLIAAPLLGPVGEAPAAGAAEEAFALPAWVYLLAQFFQYLILSITITFFSIAFQICTGWVADTPPQPPVPFDQGQGPDQTDT